MAMDLVAPFEQLDGSCISCLGPTDSALVFRGGPRWCEAGMALLVPPVEAHAIVLYVAALDYGCAWGTAPPEMSVTARTCKPCADRLGLTTGLILPGAPLPGYTQPESFRER